MSKLTSLNLVAPINTVSYGIVSLNILKELMKIIDVSLWPIGQPQVTNQQDWEYVQRACENARSYDNNAPCIRIWHQFDLAQFVGKGPHIGFPIFELDKFNKTELHHLKSCDRLFVCSEWAKEVIQKNIDEHNDVDCNVDVIPLGVDTTMFKPAAPNTRTKYVFLNIGKWEIRKGHDILAEAFDLAFTEKDDVELWLMTENVFLSAEEDAQWKQRYMNSKLFKFGKIKFIPRVKAHEEVYKIMSSADCGVFPSRAEGWNLEALEMMAANRPVILTNYSAHTQFCDYNNSHLIPVQGMELAYDDKWFFGQGNWANIRAIDVADKLNSVYCNDYRSNEPGVETAKKYTWANTAKEIINVLGHV